MGALDPKATTERQLPGLRAAGHPIAGRYRVEALVGTGASGFVVAARHVTSHERVALKILSSAHPTQPRRRLEAAQRAAGLRGEHVARVIDTGFTEEGLPFIATEWLEGRTLADELAARGRIPVGESVQWILEACLGLAGAHAAGVVHGALSPRNLLLAESPGAEQRTLKVLDFGAPSPLDGDDAEEGSAWFGSPAYLAPEQLRGGALDARADIWALGVIVHELIAGALPFTADTVAGMFVAVAYDEPALLAAEGAPFELARAVKALLAKDPAGRPVSVAALAQALAPFAPGGEALAARIGAELAAPVAREGRRKSRGGDAREGRGRRGEPGGGERRGDRAGAGPVTRSAHSPSGRPRPSRTPAALAILAAGAVGVGVVGGGGDATRAGSGALDELAERQSQGHRARAEEPAELGPLSPPRPGSPEALTAGAPDALTAGAPDALTAGDGGRTPEASSVAHAPASAALEEQAQPRRTPPRSGAPPAAGASGQRAKKVVKTLQSARGPRRKNPSFAGFTHPRRLKDRAPPK